MDPTHGDYLLGRQALANSPHLEQRIGQAADARARLESMSYGLSSVMIYKELLERGYLFDQSDYERVHGSWLAVGGEGGW